MICKVCKNDVKYPIKHHIIRVKDAPELKNEPLNIIVVCSNCHSEIHRSKDSYLKSYFYNEIIKQSKDRDTKLLYINSLLEHNLLVELIINYEKELKVIVPMEGNHYMLCPKCCEKLPLPPVVMGLIEKGFDYWNVKLNRREYYFR